MSLESLLPSPYEALAIVMMALITYATRIVGYAVLSRVKLSSRTLAMLEASPCCVMVSIAAPYFMTTDVVMLLSLTVAVLVALRFNFAITVIAAVAFNALLNHAEAFL